MSRVVAIHQPNFLPWLGYFNKMAHADVFVFLDTVQFSKTGGTWMNRVRLSVGDHEGWATAPVVRAYHGLRSVREMKLDAGPWRAKLLRTVRMAYGAAHHFGAVFPVLEPIIMNPAEDLVSYNVRAIRALTASLRLDAAECVFASDLRAAGQGTELLVQLVKAVGATTYLCGAGAAGYQDDAQFGAAGIELVHQAFRHPVYARGGAPFVPGLSVVDALMHCGFDETSALVRSSQPSSWNARERVPQGGVTRP